MKTKTWIILAVIVATHAMSELSASAFFVLPLEPKTSVSEQKVAETAYYALEREGWLKNTEISVEDEDIPSHMGFGEVISNGVDLASCQQVEGIQQQLYYSCQFSSASLENGPVARTFSSLLYQLMIDSGEDYITKQGNRLTVQDSKYWLVCDFDGDPKRPVAATCNVIQR